MYNSSALQIDMGGTVRPSFIRHVKIAFTSMFSRDNRFFSQVVDPFQVYPIKPKIHIFLSGVFITALRVLQLFFFAIICPAK